MAKLSEILASITPVERTIPMALDGGSANKIRGLLEQATVAENAGEVDEAGRLFEEISQVGQNVPLTDFTFRQMDPEAFADILDRNPPTSEQREAGLSFNDRTVKEPVVLGSLVEPEADEWDGFWKSLNWGQRQTLFDAAWGVNAEGVEIPFLQAASRITRRSKQNSPTADSEESPAASSGGGGSKKPRRTTTKKARSPATR